MPYVPRKGKGKKPAGKRSRVVRKSTRKPTVSKTIKSYVKRAIATNVENKHTFATITNQLIQPYGFSGTLLTVIPIIGSSGVGIISQGTGVSARLGNEIKVKQLMLKGWLNPIPVSAVNVDNGPFYVKMFIGKLKAGITSPTTFGSFFQVNNNNAAPQNTPFDIFRSANTEIFTIYNSKVFKIGYAATDVVNTVAVSGQPNNDFKLSQMFSINLNKHINKLKYDDAATTPTNQGIYMWFVACKADGSAIAITATAGSTEIHMDIHMTYEDA